MGGGGCKKVGERKGLEEVWNERKIGEEKMGGPCGVGDRREQGRAVSRFMFGDEN